MTVLCDESSLNHTLKGFTEGIAKGCDSVKPKGSQQDAKQLVSMIRTSCRDQVVLLTGELPELSRTSDYILSINGCSFCSRLWSLSILSTLLVVTMGLGVEHNGHSAQLSWHGPQ